MEAELDALHSSAFLALVVPAEDAARVDVRVRGGVLSDRAGNTNVESETLAVACDNRPPTVQIQV